MFCERIRMIMELHGIWDEVGDEDAISIDVIINCSDYSQNKHTNDQWIYSFSISLII